MQVNADVLEQVKKILKPFAPDGYEIKAETDLIADLGLDSLKVMKILERVEDCFDISVPLNVLPDVRTVQDFAGQIQKINEEG